MSRPARFPNDENASLPELHNAMRAGKYPTQRRCMAIVMLLTGSSHNQVLRASQVSQRSLEKWICAFNACGVNGLIHKKRPGVPPKISAYTAEELAYELEKPEVAGRTFWTAKAFHGHIRDRHGIDCSYSTVVRFFHKQGYALKVPQPWPDRQDEQKREAYRQVLEDLCRQEDIDIWYADETGIEGEPKPRRRWAPKGSQPKVVRNGDHVRMSIVGMVCPRTGEFFALEASYCDKEVFQVFLQQASESIKPQRPRNVLILDNASWHKSKLDWKFWQPQYLPPYSPDMNPIEQVWLFLKNKYFNNCHCKTEDDLIQRMDDALIDLMENPKQIQSITLRKRTEL